eukprot:IDg7333t1
MNRRASAQALAMRHLYPAMLVLCAFASFPSFGCTGAVYTEVECKLICGNASMLTADNNRALANKVSEDYRGWTDIWTGVGAQVMTTNFQVCHGQAWPRISEGVVVNGSKDRLGPMPRVAPRGPLYNGAFIRLHRGEIFTPNSTQTHLPFSVEISIWNRYDNGTQQIRRYPDYHDTNGKYNVFGGPVQCETFGFFAFFIVNESNKGMSSMLINTVALLKHLHFFGGLDGSLEIIEIAIAAEGHAGADGKFIANISSMGRP